MNLRAAGAAEIIFLTGEVKWGVPQCFSGSPRSRLRGAEHRSLQSLDRAFALATCGGIRHCPGEGMSICSPCTIFKNGTKSKVSSVHIRGFVKDN